MICAMDCFLQKKTNKTQIAKGKNEYSQKVYVKDVRLRQ